MATTTFHNPDQGTQVPPAATAATVADGLLRGDRPYVLSQHGLGRYSVAPEAAGWVQWIALDGSRDEFERFTSRLAAAPWRRS